MDLAAHLIEHYRALIDRRYRFDRLNALYDLDAAVTPERIDAVRTYFLEHVYPEPHVRRTLNEGFESLETHLRRPAEMLRLVGDMGGMALRFGFQFPRALQAGMTSLESFKAALAFEHGLMEAVEEADLDLPLTDEEFEACIAQLPRDEMDHFIGEFDNLIGALTDTKLLARTVEILTTLRDRMEDSEVYTTTDVDGLTAGIDILSNGLALFDPFTAREKRILTHLIQTVERDELDRIFETYDDD
mgnify:CR=1 FL=1